MPKRPSSSAIAAISELSDSARRRKPAGAARMLSPWLIDTERVEGRSWNNRAGSSTRTLAVLRAEIKHQDQFLHPNQALPRKGMMVLWGDGPAGARRGYVPIPTCWAC